MASTTDVPASSKSKPLFKGLPAFVADTYDWQDNFEDTLAGAIEAAVEYATKSLRWAAHEHPVWGAYVGNLSCRYEAGAIHYVLSGTPDEIRAMTDLEYGTTDHGPVPLIRPVVERNNTLLAEKIDAILAEEVPFA
jgi:hypothetical protein